MTIAELIASREPDWKELEELCKQFGSSKWFASPSGEKLARFTTLYRAVSSDLAVAESYQLPPTTIRYLNALVGRAHNCLYRKHTVSFGEFWHIFIFEAPRWLISDVTFWIALALFWIPFLTCEYVGRSDPSFAESVVGPKISRLEDMYSREFDEDFVDRLPMVAFYVFNNGGIGFKCFALGVLGGVPGLLILLSNSIVLGCSFGYMTSSAVDAAASLRFCEFTTAHGPFELTALVLSAAAGLRIGWGLVWTNGYSRLDSVRRAAIKAIPAMSAAFILFCLAATIEAFVSPSPMKGITNWGIYPMEVKRTIQYLSAFLLVFYFLGLGGLGWYKSRRRER